MDIGLPDVLLLYFACGATTLDTTCLNLTLIENLKTTTLPQNSYAYSKTKQLHYFTNGYTSSKRLRYLREDYAYLKTTTHTSKRQHNLKTTQLPQNNYTPQRDYQKDHTYLNKTTLPQIGFTTSNRLHYLKKTTLPQDVVYLSEVV